MNAFYVGAGVCFGVMAFGLFALVQEVTVVSVMVSIVGGVLGVQMLLFGVVASLQRDLVNERINRLERL